jgi:hypothetical protein
VVEYEKDNRLVDALCWGYVAALLKSAVATSALRSRLVAESWPVFSLSAAVKVFGDESWAEVVEGVR